LNHAFIEQPDDIAGNALLSWKSISPDDQAADRPADGEDRLPRRERNRARMGAVAESKRCEFRRQCKHIMGMIGVRADIWDNSAAYEAYVGRWSRPLAAEFVRWLGVSPGGKWLDVGCGTGALTEAILDVADPQLVVGCDRSPAYLAFARAHTADRAAFVESEISVLPHADFDAVVSGLVLNFLPDPHVGVAAMAARARRSGIVASYVWDYADGMQMMRLFWDAARELDPAARELDEGVRFPLCRPDALAELFTRAGVRDVEIRPIEVSSVFRNFDDYWTPFWGGQGPAPGYTMSLSEEHRERLRSLLESRLTPDSDGTISLIARAWAARGLAV
jgi:SAM-dependent methyltransferase